MAGQSKTIVIIKRTPVAASPVQPVTLGDTSQDQRKLSVGRSQRSSNGEKESTLGAIHGLSRFRWESAPAASVAIVAGIAAAILAATLVTRITHVDDSPVPEPAFVRTPEPPTSSDHDLPSDGSSSALSVGRESPPPEDRTVTSVAQPRARIRKVRPKFPDAFRGEVRVHEEIVAQPKTQEELNTEMSGRWIPPDAFPSISDRRPLLGEVNEPATGQADDGAPYAMESMSETSSTADSD